MSTFTYPISYGASVDKTPKVKRAQFGDGYQQRVGDGINTTARSWSLSFIGSKSDIDAVDLFLQNEGGVNAFNWTPPTGAAGKWLCGEWSNSITDFDHYSLVATFYEVFGE